MKKLSIQKNNQLITSVDDWKRLAPPEGGDKQWVSLHSAMELANYCIHYLGNVPKEIDEYLSRIGIKSSNFLSEPECITSLYKDGFGKAGPRHHDLLMWNNEIVIGVEAKATETLDEYVTEKCKKNGIIKYSENQLKRYPGLCERLLNKSIDKCSDIRYQLLSSAAGTLIEARNRNLNKACLLVVLFSSEIVPQNHIELTKKDIENFISCLKKNKNGSYKTTFLPNIDLFIELLVVDVKTYK